MWKEYKKKIITWTDNMAVSHSSPKKNDLRKFKIKCNNRFVETIIDQDNYIF